MYRIATVEVTPGEELRCVSPDGLAIHVGDRCVFDTGQALEIGQILSVVDGGANAPDASVPKVVRCATLQDQSKARENDLMSKMAMDSCEAMATRLGLVMRLVSVRFSFDRKHLTVLYSSEDRVDFRELVKELATEQHARIEMRQIGVRDEAGMIGGLGPCGRQQCCCSWLKNFESINVKMAKNQGLSLNPGAISGMCGRLKCCLRYENEQYREASRGMPREGAVVEGADGRGCVIDHNTMGRTIRVRLEDDRIVDYDVDDIQILRSSRRR
ncbi:MAG: stage 0 sporulation protein [Verrucomicrobia bacterium]|jgi:cell fate regulator YaaT (PSP1 superfamily)|nr:stage 0 sporulation protein [Verrucomicrobiota bacterium]